jgi:dolichyl-phosphooligosaccharide-protein glycotransferase
VEEDKQERKKEEQDSNDDILEGFSTEPTTEEQKPTEEPKEEHSEDTHDSEEEKEKEPVEEQPEEEQQDQPEKKDVPQEVEEKKEKVVEIDEPHHTKKERDDIFSEEETEKDVSFSFADVKHKTTSFFKNLKSKEKSKNKSTESHTKKKDDFAIDTKKVVAWTQKNKKWLIPLALILLTIFISSYFRMAPAYLPITDDWAESQVHSFYRNQITQSVNQQYPNLPQQNRDALIEKEFQSLLQNNKDQIKVDKEQMSAQFKSRLQDENGDTYLLAIDPYYWFAEARNYVEYGELGDSYNEEGERIFSLRNGREGRGTTNIPFHTVFGAWVYKITSIFNRDVSLMRVMFFIPVIIIGLSLIPAFLLGRKVGGNVGGFFASTIIAINAALLGRTPAGFSDTDAYNILFPLFIVWLFFEAFDAKTIKKKIMFGSLAGFISGLYAVTWLGYWYIVMFIVATIIAFLTYNILKNIQNKEKKPLFKKNVKDTVIVGGIYFITSAIFVSIFAGFSKFKILFTAPFKATAIKEVAVAKIWPNVLTTVAEFNETDLSGIIAQMGGKLLFWIGLIGIVILLFNTKKEKMKNVWYLIGSGVYYVIILSLKSSLNNPITFIILISIPVLVGIMKVLYFKENNTNIKYALLLIIWIAGTAYGFTKGMRFSILMVPAFAIAFGITIGVSYKAASEWLSKAIHIDKTISKVILIIVFCLLLITPLNDAKNTSFNEIPTMNDAWYDSLTKIKDSTQEAIITSWWDFGHWFYSISGQHVTFDGADQGERIHWVGKTLLTDDEQVSVGLLRMLNCGQQKPVHVLEEFLNGDAVRAVDIMNDMMVVNDKTKAVKILQDEGLTTAQIADIIAITYCDDLLDQFYITSEDMVGKGGVWGHFGSWDFEKAAMYQAVKRDEQNGKQTLMDKFGLTSSEADQQYYEITTTGADQWVAPWPSYQGQFGCDNLGNKLECIVGVGGGNALIEIDKGTHEAFIQGSNGQKIYPDSIVYATENDGIVEKKFTGELMGLSIVLIDDSTILLTHPLQANSMFTKLYFFDGHGLECFSKFDDRQQLTGARIATWKVDFDCQQKNNIFEQKEVVEVVEPTVLNDIEEVHAAHILISTEGRSEEKALVVITEIRKLVDATNFQELAKETSEDPGSAVNGGDLGWFGRNRMVPEFETTAFSLNPGEISDPIQTKFGYHLIYVIENR